MKTLILTLVLLVSFNLFAANPFEKYSGCYQTITMNGAAIVTDNPLQSEIYSEYSPYLDAETRSPINAVKFFIYQGKIDGLHHMQMSYVLTDLGSYSDDVYSFDGKIRFTTKPEAIYTLHIKVSVKEISDTKIDVMIFNQFDEVGPGRTTNFTLSKTSCAE